MKTFKGRMILAPQNGEVTATALVSHGGFNTLASFQKALMFGDKEAKCSDHNNPDLHNKPMAGKALCLPRTIGSTTGGMVIFGAASMGRQPACFLFSEPIDSLALSGVVLAENWTEHPIPTVDGLGDEFLATEKDGDSITVKADGTVIIG
jgi:predicted aconitase with swiveling domain